MASLPLSLLLLLVLYHAALFVLDGVASRVVQEPMHVEQPIDELKIDGADDDHFVGVSSTGVVYAAVD